MGEVDIAQKSINSGDKIAWMKVFKRRDVFEHKWSQPIRR